MPSKKGKRPNFINKPFKAILDFTCQPDDRDQINKQQSEEYVPNSQPDEEIVAEEFNLEKRILKMGSLTSVKVAFDHIVPYPWIREKDAEKIERIKNSAISGETTPSGSIYKGFIKKDTSKVLVYDGIQRIHAFRSLQDYQQKWAIYEVIIIVMELPEDDFDAILNGIQMGLVIRTARVSALILNSLKEVSLESKYKEEDILLSVRQTVESCYNSTNLMKVFKKRQDELIDFLQTNFKQYFRSKNAATDASCAILLPENILKLSLELEKKRREYSREKNINFARFTGKEMFRTLKARCKQKTEGDLENYLTALVNGDHQAYNSTDDLVTSIKNTIPTRITTINSSPAADNLNEKSDGPIENLSIENEIAPVENRDTNSSSAISEDLIINKKRQHDRCEMDAPHFEPLDESMLSESEVQIKRRRARTEEERPCDIEIEVEPPADNISDFQRKRPPVVKPLPKKNIGLVQRFSANQTQIIFAQKIERTLIERENEDVWILLEANEGRRDVKELPAIMEYLTKNEPKILLILNGIESILSYSSSANMASFCFGNAYFNEENNNGERIGQKLVIGDSVDFGEIAENFGKEKLYESAKELNKSLMNLLTADGGDAIIQKLHD